MRIRVAVATMLFALGPRLAHNQQPQPHKDTANRQQASEKSAQTIQPLTTPNKSETTSQPQNDPANDPAPWWHRSEWAIVVITGIYTLISLGTLISIRSQTNLAKEQIALIKSGEESTKKSAAAAEKSAEAAMLSAKSQISSGRSWLLIATEHTTTDPWLFDLIATNHGNSPAEILWVFSDEIVLDFGKQLPDEPDYGPQDRIFSHRQWLPNGGFFNIGEFNMALPRPDDPVTLVALKAGQKWLWTYGIIRYRDGLSRDIHETRFCYLVNFRTGPQMDGPAGYNDCT